MSGIPLKLLDSLSQPTPANEVKTRQGPGGRELSYVDARYVMTRLDELGPENWQRRHTIGPDGKVSCDIGILIEEVGWVWKGDGAGETDIEGDKGSFSDSFKRAGVNWGIARDLYASSTGQRVSSAPRPALPAAGVPPPGASAAGEPPWPGETAPQALPVTDMGSCPDHHKPFRDGKYGWFCSSKLDDGSWCKRKPRVAA